MILESEHAALDPTLLRNLNFLGHWFDGSKDAICTDLAVPVLLLDLGIPFSNFFSPMREDAVPVVDQIRQSCCLGLEKMYVHER